MNFKQTCFGSNGAACTFTRFSGTPCWKRCPTRWSWSSLSRWTPSCILKKTREKWTWMFKWIWSMNWIFLVSKTCCRFCALAPLATHCMKWPYWSTTALPTMPTKNVPRWSLLPFVVSLGCVPLPSLSTYCQDFFCPVCWSMQVYHFWNSLWRRIGDWQKKNLRPCWPLSLPISFLNCSKAQKHMLLSLPCFLGFFFRLWSLSCSTPRPRSFVIHCRAKTTRVPSFDPTRNNCWWNGWVRGTQSSNWKVTYFLGRAINLCIGPRKKYVKTMSNQTRKN